jgi:hypothetical protein
MRSASREVKLIAAFVGLVVVGTVGAGVVSSVRNAIASADAANKAFFVDITKVKPNVKVPKPAANASLGSFTVNCGKNQNGHRNPDNFIAQPGVRNGAQHLHDYVGNLSTNAGSTNASLDAAGTTCTNGDKSTYFWPVVRIDTAGNEPVGGTPGSGVGQPTGVPTVSCPVVADKLPAIPAQAQTEVASNLALLDRQIAEANQRLITTQGQGGANFINNAILGPLKDKRVATIDRIAIAIGRRAAKPTGLDALAACTLNTSNTGGAASGGQNAGGALGGAQGPNQEVAGNDGVIQTPQTVTIQFRGSPVGPVVPMPKFLRILTGDAKEATNGPANARKSWTCTGFSNRLIDKYPICPKGSLVERIHDFPSCWDGRNTDSANHRTHIVFPNATTGACPWGFKAVPQLRITLTYKIPRANQVAGQYKVDAFPQEKHNPLSDHDDFANVMSSAQMRQVVSCVNQVAPTKTKTHQGDGQDPVDSGTSALNCGNNGNNGNAGGQANNGLQILGNNCDTSKLPPHTGFQDAPRCVSTAFGEVSVAARNPSLLITQAPRRVRVNQPFTLKVSTRNLVRDRFLGAAAGGYYLESAFLTADGLTRGHFHTACRMLQSTSEAPVPDAAPAFFVATEDGGGGATPDTVTIQVTGMPATGIAQCSAWAGDGSHRVPMMQFAKETPAIDAVRITVR